MSEKPCDFFTVRVSFFLGDLSRVQKFSRVRNFNGSPQPSPIFSGVEQKMNTIFTNGSGFVSVVAKIVTSFTVIKGTSIA